LVPQGPTLPDLPSAPATPSLFFSPPAPYTCFHTFSKYGQPTCTTLGGGRR
jgi:hypothetical protein